MDVLVVVDMQEDIRLGPPKHDLAGVVERINGLARRVRGRSAVARGFSVVVVSDAHTVADRPHLAADRVKAHHEYIWADLIAPRPLRLATEAEL